jgi:hypothetical protein
VSCGPTGFSSICPLGFSHQCVIFFGGLLPGCGVELRGGLQQSVQLGLGEAVDRASLRLPAGDQAGLPEPGQVGGDIGLGAAELSGQVRDALFPVCRVSTMTSRVGLARTRNRLSCRAFAASGPRLIGMRSRSRLRLRAGPDTSGACSAARAWMPDRARAVMSLARVMGPGCCHEEGTAWRHV